MGIFKQKVPFKVAPQRIRKSTIRVETPEPKPEAQSRSSAPPTISRSSAGQSSSRPGESNGFNSARSSKTLSASPRTSTSPTSRNGNGNGNGRDRASQSPYPASDRNGGDRKRKLVSRVAHRASPAISEPLFGSESEDEEDWEASLYERERRKRTRKTGSQHVDLDRQLVHPALRETLPKTKDDNDETKKADTKDAGESKAKDTNGDGGTKKVQKMELVGRDLRKLKIIHAKDVASLALKCVPVLGAAEDEVSVELQYPGSRHRESYELVWKRDKIDVINDIKTTIKHITEVYFTDEQAKPFTDRTTGIIRQLERASSDTISDVKMFKSALDDFNRRLLAMHDDGTIAANLAKRHDLPPHFVAFILSQVYDRTVAPKVELLLKYKNGSDNVYGELLHPFVTNILVDRLQMTSGQVFVDLGSGVGNVVLQAALEVGCESWGCEMMGNACNLADEQKKEFAERCRLWGIAPGKVHLERGDFRHNAPILAALKRADVVLVNNQAFTSQLNDDLVRMFLDFKPGCKIVSLKSFVHDHKSAAHNVNDVGSAILDVEPLTFPHGFVSWADSAGNFCISTRQ